MNKEFIPYDLAKELVELGFDEKCFDVYSDVKSRLWHMPRKRTPKILWQQAFRFFREKYFSSGEIYLFDGYWHFDINKKNIEIFTTPKHGDIETYEEAQQACIKKLIEIVKQN